MIPAVNNACLSCVVSEVYRQTLIENRECLITCIFFTKALSVKVSNSPRLNGSSENAGTENDGHGI